MKSKNATFSLLLVLTVLAVALLKWRQEPERKEAFDRTPPQLEYSRQARCRMNCRGISERAVKEIMKKGIINFSRSNRRNQPCPIFALQGRTSEDRSIRVIFTQCARVTTVLDCYNLAGGPACPCPENEPKNQ